MRILLFKNACVLENGWTISSDKCMSLPKLYMVQFDAHVGDVAGNAERIINIIRDAAQTEADIVVFPELALCGYPPEDLLLRSSMDLRITRAIEKIQKAITRQAVVLGYPTQAAEQRFNAAGVFRDGVKIAEYRKRTLPNFRVFDEKRYFSEGEQACVFEHDGLRYGLTICEDLWHEEPVKDTVNAGAEILININASPFHKTKVQERLEVIEARADAHRIPIVYLNTVGGQDELVFDGGSCIADASGKLIYQAPWFEEAIELVDMADSASLTKAPFLTMPAACYSALVLGVRDYVQKNGFPGVIIGLSGGIDSALTLAIAVDALGPDQVEAVMMPFHYTSEMSRSDAAEQAEKSGVKYGEITIAPMVDAFSTALAPEFEGLAVDTTEQNIQARCRGTLLMAISNKKGSLVLTTGNKSEMAVGYATLYGDMAGGFDVLKDVSKMLVYELARYRNSTGGAIPQRVIDRPPSAELAPDQIDEDSLPPYEILDQILEMYIEQDMSAEKIVDEGFSEQIVQKILRLVDINEYKRRQAAIGPRITTRGFGRDRRYPITNGWKIGD